VAARTRRGIPTAHTWTAEHVALLGTLPADEVAARIGRTANAVSVRRSLLGIARACNRRQREHGGRKL